MGLPCGHIGVILPQILENKMEKSMENEVETTGVWGDIAWLPEVSFTWSSRRFGI